MRKRELANKTILITGGAGFIGSHLAEALVLQNDIKIIDNFSSGKYSNLPEDVEVIDADIRDKNALNRACKEADIIFHQAGVISVTESIDDPIKSNDVNIEATLTLLEMARTHDARIIVASSCAIYGHPSSIPIKETQHTEPTSPYGLQKLTADKYTSLYNELYGLETVALRYFNVYGPRQSNGEYSGVISIFKNQSKSGKNITVNGDGDQTRDFIHVSDVVQANILAANTSHVGESYNIGTGKSISITELAEKIQRLSNKSSEITYTHGRPGDIRHSEADISKAKNKLGFEPSVSINEGLQQLMNQ